MKPGMAVTIRVRPLDCQSVLDVAAQLGMPADSAFSQLVSTALQSLLETARQQKLLPEPDPFQFSERMAPYWKGKNSAKKVKTLAAAEAAGSEVSAVALAKPRAELVRPARQVLPAAAVETAPAAVEVVADPDAIERAQNVLTMLILKKEMHEDDPEANEWTQEDQQKWDRNYAIVYPAG